MCYQPRSQGFLPFFVYGYSGEDSPGLGCLIRNFDWSKFLSNYAKLNINYAEIISIQNKTKQNMYMTQNNYWYSL